MKNKNKITEETCWIWLLSDLHTDTSAATTGCVERFSGRLSTGPGGSGAADTGLAPPCLWGLSVSGFVFDVGLFPRDLLDTKLSTLGNFK